MARRIYKQSSLWTQISLRIWWSTENYVVSEGAHTLLQSSSQAGILAGATQHMETPARRSKTNESHGDSAARAAAAPLPLGSPGQLLGACKRRNNQQVLVYVFEFVECRKLRNIDLGALPSPRTILGNQDSFELFST